MGKKEREKRKEEEERVREGKRRTCGGRKVRVKITVCSLNYSQGCAKLATACCGTYTRVRATHTPTAAYASDQYVQMCSR